MSFRQMMKEDIKWRIVDLLGHVILSMLLPGYWWFQFLPDIFVPVLGFKSFKTDKLLPNSDWAVVGNVMLHNILCPVMLALIFTAVIGDYKVPLYMYLQWTFHIAWDTITHRQDWNKKSLI